MHSLRQRYENHHSQPAFRPVPPSARCQLQAPCSTISITCASCKYFCLFTKPSPRPRSARFALAQFVLSRPDPTRLDSARLKCNTDSNCQNTQLISARQYCLLAKHTRSKGDQNVEDQHGLLRRVQGARGGGANHLKN